MHNLFGTDGIRHRMGTGILIQEHLIALGSALAQWAQQRYQHRPRILITHDTRASASFVKAALKTGLLRYPVEITDTFVLPTPAMAHFCKHMNYDCAVIISASHNPFFDNGIKILDALTGKLSPTDEHLISLLAQGNAPMSSYDSLGHDEPWSNASERYCSYITQLFPRNILQGMHIVLDTAHGATFRVAPEIFTSLGARVHCINNAPTGYNINEQCGSTDTTSLAAAVVQHKAHIGFAFDGDGDRVIAVTSNGIIKDGDDLLALLLDHPAYCTTPQVVGTVMTNEGLTTHLRKQNKQLLRTPVGDKHIAEKLLSERLLLGGEPSGHVILNDILSTGDGILVALRVLESICHRGNWLMKTFDKYPQATMNLPVTNKKNLSEHPLRTIIETAQQQLVTGRVLVRYSGTENVLRVMVETDDNQYAAILCEQLAAQLSKAL